MRFGAFEVNLDERDLRRDGAKIKLNEKPFQVLAVLLERAGRVVRRDEIRSRLWPADTYVDFDVGVSAGRSRERISDHGGRRGRRVQAAQREPGTVSR